MKLVQCGMDGEAVRKETGEGGWRTADAKYLRVCVCVCVCACVCSRLSLTPPVSISFCVSLSAGCVCRWQCEMSGSQR